MSYHHAKSNPVPTSLPQRLLPAGMKGGDDPVFRAIMRTAKAHGVVPLVFAYCGWNKYGGLFGGYAEDEENIVLVSESYGDEVFAESFALSLLEACSGNSDMARDILDDVIKIRDEYAKNEGYEDLSDYYEKTLIEPYDRVVEMKKKSKVKELDRTDVIRELNRIIISKKKEE